MKESTGMDRSSLDLSEDRYRESLLGHRPQFLIGFGALAAAMIIVGPLPIVFATPFTGYDHLYGVGLLAISAAALVFSGLARQRRTEERISRDLQRLNTILAASPVGLSVVRNRILEWSNDASNDMFGYQHEHEFLGRSAEIFYPSDDEFRRVGKALYEDLGDGRIAHSDGKFKRRDGTVFDAHLAVRALDPSDPSKGIVAALFDISDMKRTEEALLESEEKYRLLFSNEQDAILLAEAESLKFLDANASFERLYGYTRDDLLSMKMVEISATARKSDLTHQVEAEPGAGAALRWHRKKDGTIFPVEMSSAQFNWKGKPVVCSIIRDATERYRAEEDLWLLATAVEQSGEAIVVTDGQGEIKYVNPAFERNTGYARQEVIGRNPRFLKSGQQDQAFYENLWKTITGGATWTGRFINKRKDGSFFHEDATISPVRDSEGVVNGFVGVKRDVTEQINLNRQLQQAQKMESIGTLASGIAHDFNNVLTVILGFSELLLADMSPEDKDYGDLRTIVQTARNGADLVKRIMTFCRNVETLLEPTDLNDELRNIHALLERTLPKMISTELSLADDLMTIHADSSQLEQIILNLAINARDAMPRGGTLAIATRNVTLDRQCCQSRLGVEPGDYILLTVSDTGHGMEPTVVEHIFEPFFTTKNPGDGTGLGLAMVFGIVKNHGGHITCYSTPGIGTTFKICFPVMAGEQDDNTSVSGEVPVFGTETILFVDDEAPVRNLGEKALTRSGYKVLLAADGEEAMNIYYEWRNEISLVVLDLLMPKMGGKECLHELLYIDPQARVLIASGFSQTEHAKRVIGEGAKGFIDKPYQIKQLLRKIREILDER